VKRAGGYFSPKTKRALPPKTRLSTAKNAMILLVRHPLPAIYQTVNRSGRWPRLAEPG